MLAGGALLALVGVATGEVAGVDLSAVSTRSALALFYLTVFGSIVAFTAYVWLLRVSTPARVSTYAYVMQRGLDRARYLLASGAPIATTAHHLGFSDQSHLTRWFLRIVGVTPGEYARAQVMRLSSDTHTPAA